MSAAASAVDVGDDDARALGGEHRRDAAADAPCGAGDDCDLIGEWLHEQATIVAPMQRFLARDAKFSYSPGHAAIGTVQPGERFEVESVEGFYNSFASASDFTPERYAEAEKLKWAVTGPIAVAGAGAGGAVAVTIHAVEVTTPGVVVYGGYTAEEPLEWWDDESACAVYPGARAARCASTSARRCRPAR